MLVGYTGLEILFVALTLYKRIAFSVHIEELRRTSSAYQIKLPSEWRTDKMYIDYQKLGKLVYT